MGQESPPLAAMADGAKPSPPPPRPGWWARLKQRWPFLGTKKGIAAIVLIVSLILLSGLAGLAALKHGNGGAAGSEGGGSGGGNGQPAFVVTSDTYFYGLSEPVYPSPGMTGVGPWETAFTKAKAMVANMTLSEKISLTSGVSSNTSCSGNIPAIRRLDFPGLCLSDAGNGLRATDFVNAWPSGVHVAASWNRDLALRRAVGMGGEFRSKGVNVALGPVVGPAGRTLSGGRNWEGFSVDPYLSGALVFETVSGIQQAGVITSTKHYIANEQETNRNPENGAESVSANIDDKTMHELYLWPFQDAVHAGTGNIMCSYNRVNNSYGCANSKTLNGLLKTELGFQGFVVSDWGAQHAGVATALSGLDMAMPDDGRYWGYSLQQAVNNGSVPESRVDDMAVRIVAAWYQMGQDHGFPVPGIGMPPDLLKPHPIIDGRNASSKQTLLDGAVEGHVLIKNFNATLPFRSPSLGTGQGPRLISVFGYSAKAPDQNAYAGSGSPWVLGGESGNGPEIFSGTAYTRGSAIALNGTIISGGGSGANAPAHMSSPFDALSQQCYDDGVSLFWDFHSSAPAVDPASDVCIVVVNAWAAESYDRPALRDDYTDGLIISVADACASTVVVMHNAGPRLVDRWIDHANVTAVIFAHLPGQDSGRALVSILFGKSNPSGRLPYTVARNESDYAPTTLIPTLPSDGGDGMFKHFPQSNFTEGTVLDYRYFDVHNIAPRFEFGFGLSYTTFAYSDLSVAATAGANVSSPYPVGPVREGGHADLWDVLFTASATVANTGGLAGADVAQLYVAIPGAAAPRQLRGFAKPFLNASASARVDFPLTRRDLSTWDVGAQAWLLQKGSYGLWVGRSSRDLKLNGTLTV